MNVLQYFTQFPEKAWLSDNISSNLLSCRQCKMSSSHVWMAIISASFLDFKAVPLPGRLQAIGRFLSFWIVSCCSLLGRNHYILSETENEWKFYQDTTWRKLLRYYLSKENENGRFSSAWWFHVVHSDLTLSECLDARHCVFQHSKNRTSRYLHVVVSFERVNNRKIFKEWKVKEG